MSWFRNFLISIGAACLSAQPVALISWLFSKVSDRIIYGSGVTDAIAMGVMLSMGSAICAGLGAAIVTLSATGAKPQRWAWIVALFYVTALRTHYHWHTAPTTWDRVEQAVDLLWPAVACMAVATIISRLRRKSETAKNNNASAAQS